MRIIIFCTHFYPYKGGLENYVLQVASRLVKKGAIKVTEEGYRYRYSAAVKEAACVRSEMKSFVRRVDQGAAKPALAAFVENTDLSDREIDEMQKILDRKRKG